MSAKIANAMTRVSTQRCAPLVALIMPLALIAGMLSFPSSCACGADLPHSHALFTLAGHTHHGTTHQHGKHGDATANTGNDPNAGQYASSTPVVEVQAGSMTTSAQGALPAHEQSTRRIATHAPIRSNHDTLRAAHTTPEIPPPQSASVS